MMTDHTVDNIEMQLEEFVKKGEVNRDGRFIEVNYPEHDIYITCEPTGEENDVGAERFLITAEVEDDVNLQEQANPDMISTFIHNVLKRNIGVENM